MQINFEHMQKNLIEVVEYLESLEVLDATEIKNDVQIWGNDKSENNTKSKFKGLKKSSDFIQIALIFIIPKKNSTVHLISHFRYLKKNVGSESPILFQKYLMYSRKQKVLGGLCH